MGFTLRWPCTNRDSNNPGITWYDEFDVYDAVYVVLAVICGIGLKSTQLSSFGIPAPVAVATLVPVPSHNDTVWVVPVSAGDSQKHTAAIQPSTSVWNRKPTSLEPLAKVEPGPKLKLHGFEQSVVMAEAGTAA